MVIWCKFFSEVLITIQVRTTYCDAYLMLTCTTTCLDWKWVLFLRLCRNWVLPPLILFSFNFQFIESVWQLFHVHLRNAYQLHVCLAADPWFKQCLSITNNKWVRKIGRLKRSPLHPACFQTADCSTCNLDSFVWIWFETFGVNWLG